MDIVVVGSINMDRVVKVPWIPRVGETILSTDYKEYGGGKGANQAIASARLKNKVAMVGKVGQDQAGEDLLRLLKEDGVDTSGIGFSKKPTGTAFINVDNEANNNIVVYQGANADVDTSHIDKNIDLIKKSKLCIVQLEIPLETVEYVINICRDNGVKLIFNPAPAIKNIDLGLLRKPDILIPNETELAIILGEEGLNLSCLEDKMLDLAKAGLDNLVVTLGENGGAYLDAGNFSSYNIVDVDPIDSTGAGDSFIAGLATGLVGGRSLEESIDFARYVAALAVSRPGAQASFPSLKEVKEFIKAKN